MLIDGKVYFQKKNYVSIINAEKKNNFIVNIKLNFKDVIIFI